MLAQHIIFVGFMGSGKTTISRMLARQEGIPLIDTDQLIELDQGRSIKQIFAEEGEEGFRAIETESLASLANREPMVISCGGGVIGRACNREILKTLGTVVYLQISCQGAINRIHDPSTRPMLSGARPVQEIYDERIPWYEEVADVTVNVEGGTKRQNINAVTSALKERGLL